VPDRINKAQNVVTEHPRAISVDPQPDGGQQMDRVTQITNELEKSETDEQYGAKLFELAKVRFESQGREALTWLFGLSSERSNVPAFRAAGAWIAKYLPDQVETVASQISVFGFRANFLETACGQMAMVDVEKAWGVCLRNTQNFTSDQRIQSKLIYQALVNGKIETAERFYSSLPTQIHDSDPSISTAMARGMYLSGSNGMEKAQKFLLGLASSPVAVSVLPEVIAGWPQDKLLDVSVLLRSFPPGFAKDRGIAELVDKIKLSSPHDAAIWADSVQSSKLRFQIFETIAVTAANFSPEQAKSLILSSVNLSPTEKSSILQKARVK
jgi:hypothetical protein